jgi:hypothetical protein
MDRAVMLAQMAPHPSVTTSVLAGDDDRFDDGRLAGPPPVTYLDDTEAPAFVLTNTKRGVGVGSKRNRRRPADGHGTVVLVTGRRVLCLVGQATDDEVIDLPYEEIAAVSYHTGLLANRIELSTPTNAYHLWLPRGTDEQLLSAVESYVAERRQAEDTAGEGVPTYRGRPIRDAGTTDDGGEASGAEPAADEAGSGAGTHADDGDGDVTYRGQSVDSSSPE